MSYRHTVAQGTRPFWHQIHTWSLHLYNKLLQSKRGIPDCPLNWCNPTADSVYFTKNMVCFVSICFTFSETESQPTQVHVWQLHSYFHRIQWIESLCFCRWYAHVGRISSYVMTCCLSKITVLLFQGEITIFHYVQIMFHDFILCTVS